MRELRQALPILSVAFLLLLAGCIWGQAPPKPEVAPGVVITGFIVEPPEIEPPMPAYVSLIVQNKGEAMARDVTAELLGLPEEFAISPNRTQEIGDLIPPDPERGFPEGQEGYLDWTITAPPKDVTMDYDFSVRVYYTYDFYSESVLRVITMEYYMGLSPEEREKKEWGIIQSRVTAGPLRVTVEAPKPIVTAEVTIPVWFKIENIGGGRAFRHIPDVRKPTLETLDVIEIAPGPGLTCPETEVRLIRGEYGRLSCTLDIGRFENLKDFEITLSSTYGYYIDGYATLRVLKKLVIAPP